MCEPHTYDDVTTETKCLQGAPIKNNPLDKMIYFSHGSMDLSQTFIFYVSILTRYPVNFIEITGIVPQIQRFKL